MIFLSLDLTTKPYRNAFALPLVIWGVLLISIAVTGTAVVVNNRLSDTSFIHRASRARDLALTGIAYGSHPVVPRYDPLLSQEISPVEKLHVTIRSEGVRCNINAILKGNDLQPLQDLFTYWGMESTRAAYLVASLADWTDKDDVARPNGAEIAKYVELGKVGVPLNTNFRSLNEMAAVAGMEELTAIKPHWRDYFTVWGSNKMDINEADAELIAIFGQIPLETAQTLVAIRNGADTFIGTMDDQRFTSVTQATETLGLTKEQTERLNQWFETTNNVERIESRAEVGGFVKTITVIMQKQTTEEPTSTILAWLEN